MTLLGFPVVTQFQFGQQTGSDVSECAPRVGYGVGGVRAPHAQDLMGHCNRRVDQRGLELVFF